MSTILENDTEVSIYFDSLIELMDYNPPAANAKLFAAYIGRDKTHSEFALGKTWYGPTNQTSLDVINHALLGDEELYQNLKKKIDELDRAVGRYTTDYTQHITKVKREKFKSNFGDEIDIHKVYQGQMNTAWTKTRRVEVDQVHHLVTILVDYVGNCSEKVGDTLWRAAVAVKLVDDLASAGKSVKLMCGSKGRSVMRDSSKLVSTSVVIKNYNERLSLPRLAAMTHLGFFRSAGFAMLCSQHRKVQSHLGYPVTLTEANIPLHIKNDVDAGHTKYVPVGRVSDRNSAVRALNEAYEIMRSFS